MGITDTGIGGERDFPSTAWSAIRHAQDPASPEYERHLRRLVELYWRPVYFVIRYSWARTHEDAEDLTQEFFASVIFDRALVRTFAPERGSFRGLLRTAITNFMRNTVRDAKRQKRGGDTPVLSLDAAEVDAAEVSEQAASLTPEELFDMAWNQAVMAQAIERLRERLTADGKEICYQVFKRYDLESEREQLSYAQIGDELGLTPAKVKHALLQARALLREIVTEIVRDYVDGPQDLAAELRAFFGA